MPGITGIIGKAPTDRKAALGLLVKCMQHEPFYNFGSLLVDKLECAAGWVCHQGSFSDCMPAWNEARDICLVFWGEHFADASELQSLKAAGHQCTDSHGRLSGASVTKRTRNEVLRTAQWHVPWPFDRLAGKQGGFSSMTDMSLGRIYYHESPDGFYFSAEAKSLLKVLPQLRRLDLRSFGEFFSCGCALQHRTLFDGVSLLPPGSAWTFRPGQPVRKETYFQKEEWEALPQLPAEDYYQRLKETFTRILPRYFGGSQPGALSLTGGLDSRMIIAAAPRAPGALPCFTFGGMYRDCEDVTVGRQVAGLCGQSHSVIPRWMRNFSSNLSQGRRPGVAFISPTAPWMRARRSAWWSTGAPDNSPLCV